MFKTAVKPLKWASHEIVCSHLSNRVQLLIAALIILLPLANSRAFPSYLVLGQQKSGTSTLWALMSTHPQLMKGTTGGGHKEPIFFQSHTQSAKKGTYGEFVEHCDRSLEKYLDLWPNQESGHLAGDFSASQLCCYCCPEILRKIIPKAKLIVVLRDPVSRSLSRFLEQWNWPFWAHGLLDKVIRKFPNFESYVASETQKLEDCMKLDRPLPEGGDHQQLLQHAEYKCLAASNIVGWSAYSVFLKRWLEFFPKEQLLVLYTNELEADPGGTMRKVEAFLGVKEYKYDDTLLHTKYNTRFYYGWQAGLSNETTVKEEEANTGTNYSKWKNSALKVDAGQTLQRRTHRPPSKRPDELTGNTSGATAFMRPYMLQLKAMADIGLIPQLPAEMMAPYAR